MPDIVIQAKSGGIAVNGLTDPPEITILRLDTDAVVVAAAAMSDQAAGGLYKFAFEPVAGINYSFSVDADPSSTGQTDDLFYSGAFNNGIDYSDGAIWIDTFNGTAGTRQGINGTQDNPVDSLADALTLSAATGIKRFYILECSITFTTPLENYEFIGKGPSGISGSVPRIIDLDGNSPAGCYFENLFVIGDADSPLSIVRFNQCALSNLLNCRIQADFCGLQNTISLSNTSFFHQCYSRVPGGGTVTIDVQGEDLNNRGYSGGATLGGVTGGASVSMEFIAGQVILNASNTNGNIQIRGVVSPVVDNTAGATVVQVAAVQGIHVDEVWQNEGLDPDNPKTITVNSATDMDEDVDLIHKDSVTVGNTTTQTRV